MYKVEYTALKYYNSIVSEECLYVGMLFNNLTTGKRDFRVMTNFNRFQAFDDEEDVNFMRAYLRGIKETVENSLFNNQTAFDTKEFIRYFVNEFKFTEVRNIEVEEDENYIENLANIYMRFDIPKGNRLNIDEQKKYIRRILASENLSFTSPKIIGNYEENIKFDYIIDNKIAIKLFQFKDKKETKRLINTAKTWSFTAEEMKEKLDIIFMYDTVDMEDENFDIISKILKKNAVFYPIDKGVEHILNEFNIR